jgi:uncharacterized protein
MGVTATPAALEAITRLQGELGPLAFFQSMGGCDGSSPICLRDLHLVSRTAAPQEAGS